MTVVEPFLAQMNMCEGAQQDQNCNIVKLESTQSEGGWFCHARAHPQSLR